MANEPEPQDHDPRLDDPMLRDAVLRARSGGAHGTAGGSNPTAAEGATAEVGARDYGTADFGGPREDDELSVAEERAVEGVPTGGSGESRSAVLPGDPDVHRERQHPHVDRNKWAEPGGGNEGASGPGTSILDEQELDAAASRERRSPLEPEQTLE